MRSFFIISTSAVCLLSSAAFTQQAIQDTASTPDLSGIWTHPYIPGFEPPISGPGPIVNRSRQKQIFDMDGRPIPPRTNVPLVGNTSRYEGDYTNPILQPWVAALVKRFGETESDGVASPNPTNQCWPEPVPFIFWNIGIQMIQGPGKITILYGQAYQVRHVRMNVPHPATVTPSWYGDSVGHYEGATLVIDTVGVKADRPLAVVDFYGTPYTQALHVVERYRLLDYASTIDALKQAEKENFRVPASNDSGLIVDPNYKGNGLQLQFTVEDEGAFTMPWSATITYRRPLATGWSEFVCAENRHEYYAGIETPVPHSEKPDF
jgi:hypothetical protein